MNPGSFAELEVSRFTVHGAYLTDGSGSEVLLPKGEMPPEVKEGSTLRVFIYRDSEDRLTATLVVPAVTVDDTAVLPVVDVNKYGAFLNWGLPKDLFLPFGEMKTRPSVGDRVLVTLYRDKSDRLCASMKKAAHCLKTVSDHRVGDEVRGFVYDVNPELGAFVAVDEKYSAMLPASDRSLSLNDLLFTEITARVSRVREDGRLDLSLNKRIDKRIDEDSEKLLSLIKENGGSLPVGDRSDPALILKLTGMSKASFKRASGRLYREGLAVPGKISISVVAGRQDTK